MRRAQAVVLVVCAVVAGYAAWFLLALRHAVTSLVDRLGGSGVLVVDWNVGRLHAAYWSVLAILLLVLVVSGLRRQRRRVVATGVLLVVAATTLPVSPLPLSGGFTTGGTTVSVTADPSWAVAAGCWVVVALGAPVLAVRSWRGQPPAVRPRPPGVQDTTAPG